MNTLRRCWSSSSAAGSRVEQLVREATDLLASSMPRQSRDRLRSEAQALLAKAAQLPNRQALVLASSVHVSERHEQVFWQLLRRRALLRQPLAQLVGKTEFYSLEFQVSADVLTPRPESELLVDLALSSALVTPATTVFDVGCGSACLLLSVLTHSPASVRGVGLDCSANALVVAQRNAVALGLLPRTRFALSNWMDEWPLARATDGPWLVLCNPPYVESRDWLEREPELRHEPPEALFGTPETTYSAMLASVRSRAPRDTVALVEFGSEQAARVARVAEASGWRVERVARDAGGHERAVQLRTAA